MEAIGILAVIWVVGWLIFAHLPGEIPKILIMLAWIGLAGTVVWQLIALLL